MHSFAAEEEIRYGTVKKHNGGLYSQGYFLYGIISVWEDHGRDYIQIPWDEVDTIVASVLFKGRKISRFAVMTKSSGTFSFSSRDNKALLRAVANYVDKERMVRSLSFLDVIKRSIRRIVHRKKEDQASC